MDKKCNLSDVADVFIGKSIVDKGDDKSTKVVSISDINNVYLDINNLKSISYGYADNEILQNNDILIKTRGALGVTTIVKNLTNEKIVASHPMLVIRAKNIDPNYLYYQLNSEKFKHYCSKNNEGSIISMLSTKMVRGYNVDIVEYEKQELIGKIFLLNKERINKINIKNELINKYINQSLNKLIES